VNGSYVSQPSVDLMHLCTLLAPLCTDLLRSIRQLNLVVFSESAAAAGIILDVDALMTLNAPRTTPRRARTRRAASSTHITTHTYTDTHTDTERYQHSSLHVALPHFTVLDTVTLCYCTAHSDKQNKTSRKPMVCDAQLARTGQNVWRTVHSPGPPGACQGKLQTSFDRLYY